VATTAVKIYVEKIYMSPFSIFMNTLILLVIFTSEMKLLPLKSVNMLDFIEKQFMDNF